MGPEFLGEAPLRLTIGVRPVFEDEGLGGAEAEIGAVEQAADGVFDIGFGTNHDDGGDLVVFGEKLRNLGMMAVKVCIFFNFARRSACGFIARDKAGRGVYVFGMRGMEDEVWRDAFLLELFGDAGSLHLAERGQAIRVVITGADQY